MPDTMSTRPAADSQRPRLREREARCDDDAAHDGHARFDGNGWCPGGPSLLDSDPLFREALEALATGCTRTTQRDGSQPPCLAAGRTIDSSVPAHRACSACVAEAALEGHPLPREADRIPARLFGAAVLSFPCSTSYDCRPPHVWVNDCGEDLWCWGHGSEASTRTWDGCGVIKCGLFPDRSGHAPHVHIAAGDQQPVTDAV